MKALFLLVFALMFWTPYVYSQDNDLTHAHLDYGSDCHIMHYDSIVDLEIKFKNQEKLKRVKAYASDGLAFIEGGLCLGRIAELKRRDTRSLQCDMCGMWENGIVPYEIDPAANYSDYTLNQIQTAIEMINSQTNVCIIPRTNETAYVKIINGGGCWSYVGKIGGMQELSIREPGCNLAGTIAHEFLHALGIFHEQSREDRNDYITVYYDNITPGFENNFDQMINDSEDFGDYDYGSVMHYSAFAFTANGSPTIVKNDGTYYGLGQRDSLSQSDIAGVNDLYATAVGHPDYATLMTLYDALDGENWIDVVGWRENNNCNPCSWTGITCTDDRVTAIDLSSKGLNGLLPAFEPLTELVEINLSDNDLHGALPIISQTLYPNLVNINLSGNQYTFDELEGNFLGIPNCVAHGQSPFELSLVGDFLSAEGAGGQVVHNTYRWYLNDDLITVISGSNTLDVNAFQSRERSTSRNNNDVYRVEVENETISNVLLSSNDFILESVFPVTMEDFTAHWNPHKAVVELQWIVSKEVDNAGWTIERSSDGTDFYDINWVDGAGTSNQKKEYAFVDHRPGAGFNYYRLRQVDLDGSETISSIVQVYYQDKKISVEPSFISNNEFYIRNANSLRYNILDMLGASVLKGDIYEDLQPILIDALPSGHYIVRVENYTFRITKQ